ncbi:hypothetical protein PENSPDRAFT_62236 [Peniophora sp. CONT]|nr:hypothetical protein PENSPDRAFT_62236 [Peniophora sp. CONT]
MKAATCRYYSCLPPPPLVQLSDLRPSPTLKCPLGGLPFPATYQPLTVVTSDACSDMIGRVLHPPATKKFTPHRTKPNRRGPPLTEERLLAIFHLLPNIIRGSAAHFSLLRELADSPDAITALQRALPGKNVNAIVPAISVLPEEIMSMIFCELAVVAPPRGPMVFSDLSVSQYAANVLDPVYRREKREKEYTGRVLVQFGAGPNTLGWILLGHVCSSWRELVFSMPSLWARHLGKLPGPAFDGMLYWSRDRPVHISSLSSSMRPGAEQELLAALRGHPQLARRVTHMRLERTQRESGSCCDLNSILDGAETPQFTNLPILDVCANVAYLPNSDYNSFPVINAPTLTQLRFEDFFLRWNSSVLVNLDISAPSGKLYIPTLLLMDLLRASSSSLRCLHLTNCLNTSREDMAHVVHAPASPVVLSAMEYFLFGCHDADFIMFFLTHAVAIPRESCLTLHIHRPGSHIGQTLPLLRFAWEKFLDSSRDISLIIMDPQLLSNRETTRGASDGCRIGFWEGLEPVQFGDRIIQRPKLTFQCCAASGIAPLSHLLKYMDNYRITMLSLLFKRQFSFETTTIMASLPHVHYLHINDYRCTDLDSRGPIPVLCDSLDYLPNLETLSIAYNPSWTLPWAEFSHYLAQRPSIRTLIVRDGYPFPIGAKEHHFRQVLGVMGRQGLEIRWVPWPSRSIIVGPGPAMESGWLLT